MLSVLETNIKIMVSVGVMVMVFSSVGGADHNRVVYKGLVTSFKLNIRETPANTASVVAVVEQGETIDVLKKQGDIGGWLTVAVKGKKGYVRNRPEYIHLTLVPRKIQVKKQVKKNRDRSNETNPEGGANILDRLQTQEKMVETFSQKEVEIIEGLNEIDYAVNKARTKIMALSRESEQLAGKIAQYQQERDRLSKEMTLNREYAGKRLTALYKMSRIGRLDVPGRPTSVFDFVLQQNSMKRIITSDVQLLERQDSVLEKFEILEQSLQREIQAKTALETDIKDQIRMNEKEIRKKEVILKEIRGKKALSLAAVDALKQAARQLEARIDQIQKGAVAPAEEGDFSQYKGRLMIPVSGEIMSTYGPSMPKDYKVFTFQKGIDIRVERGEPVKSVFKGEIIFAQWLKGYGNLLIINHGDHYYTLYAHVEEIFKDKGETVETGEVIATAGDTGSIKGMCLHFEVRHHGKPLNPMKWLRKGA
ncbi:peptidoglycan DD-metalloendopeptidase family protein [Desulfobacula sp.]|uniref:peptidoglycan DD-metalloendopeptidase family protein n=1 Tax=Desulfobacula sp. TaxID=2593537 RepID=UPI0026312993|nr:peptidoglycan DD-metalloendopeptidase family protein [Desulfobacula sp.]